MVQLDILLCLRHVGFSVLEEVCFGFINLGGSTGLAHAGILTESSEALREGTADTPCMMITCLFSGDWEIFVD